MQYLKLKLNYFSVCQPPHLDLKTYVKDAKKIYHQKPTVLILMLFEMKTFVSKTLSFFQISIDILQ